MTDTIHIAKAACGTGKTQQLVEQFDKYKQVRTLIVCPTIALCDDINSRLKEQYNDLILKVIHSDRLELKDSTVEATLPTQLDNINHDYSPRFRPQPISKKPASNVIIITADSFQTIAPDKLDGWVIIMDELPEVVKLEEWKVTTASIPSLARSPALTTILPD